MKNLAIVAGLMLVPALTAQNGLKFTNGTANYVDVKYDKSLVPQSGVTVEAWITYDENLGAGWRWPTIVRQNPMAGQESFLFRVDAGQSANRNLRWWVLGTRGSLNVFYTFPSGTFSTFKHVAGTYDGSVANLYVDGKLVASRTGSVGPLWDRGNAMKIGNGDGNGIENWNGEIDEVRLWPFARTAGEIMQTRNMELQRVPGGVSTWNFNNSVADSSGANNGTWVGTSQYATNSLTLQRLPVSGAFEIGTATPGCQGTSVLTIGSIAQVGNADFALTSTSGAPSSASILLLGAKTYASPIKILGVDVWLDISTLAVTVGVPTTPLGAARVALPIPNDTKYANISVATQMLHIDSSCTANNFSTSPALTFTIR